MELDGVGGDVALLVEEIEEGDTGDVDDDVAGNVLEAIGGHAEAGFEFAARGFEIARVARGARAGAILGGNLRDHGGAGVVQIGEEEVEVAVVFLLDGDELRADGEGLEFERRDARVRGKRRWRGLGNEPGDGRGARREIDAGGVRVGEGFDGPAFGAAGRAAGDEVSRRAGGRALLPPLAIEVERGENDEDCDRN